MSDPSDLVLLFTGDVSIQRSEVNQPPESIFALVEPIFRQADIRFCQLESVFSNIGGSTAHKSVAFRTAPENASALKYAGFDVLSLAGNHCMDSGPEALLDCVELLTGQGFHILGVGKNIAEARKPVVLEREGTRIGFLTYNSILPPGFRAKSGKAGCSPLGVYTHYEQVETHQPGTPCLIRTFPVMEDLEAMKQDIECLRARADVVVVSFHWGLHFIPAALAEYERVVGHIAIDTGADLIIAHHPHILKGIEVYKGKVIFYSLGNFAFDSRWTREDFEEPNRKAKHKLLDPGWEWDPDYPGYQFPVDTRKTLVAKCAVSDGRVQRVSFLPAFINRDAQPEILSRQDDRFGQVINYVKGITESQGLRTNFSLEGDEVVIQF